MGNIFLSSFVIQAFTAAVGLFTIPLFAQIAGADELTQYLYVFSIASIASLIFSGISLSLSSSVTERYDEGLNLLKIALLVLPATAFIAIQFGVYWASFPIIVLTILVTEATKGLSINRDEFRSYQLLNLTCRTLVVGFMAVMLLKEIDFEFNFFDIVLIQTIPAIFLGLRFLTNISSKKFILYSPINYYKNNASLIFTRSIASGQEHFIRIALIALISSELVVFYEFLNRLCRQTKGVFDNALSYLIREFERESFIQLRFVMLGIMILIFSFIIFSALGGNDLIEYLLGFNLEINIVTVTIPFFCGYMLLLSTTVLMHYSAANNDFRIFLRISIVRMIAAIAILALMYASFINFIGFIWLSSLVMFLIGVYTLWKLTKKMKI